MSDVRDFGAKGDGQHDDTEAIRHAVASGDGPIEFLRGDYIVSETIDIDLAKVGRTGLSGANGTAKILMAGAGPAFRFRGTHASTADPGGFRPAEWARERMPTVLNLEIEGRHEEADGIELVGVMQPTLEGVLLRELRDGVRVVDRARNLLISHCHIYHNRRSGVFLDNCNLHQVVIVGNHISYNAQAGIHILGGEVRNVQITGNDIEYNYRSGRPDSADVLIDCTPKGSSINEGTIASNTIQSRLSPQGANIRMLGAGDNTAGMFAISGNLIGSQEYGIHLSSCCATTISGNMIYGATRRNILVEHSRNIVVGANSVDHNTDGAAHRQLATGVRLSQSRDVSLTGLQIKDSPTSEHTLKDAPPLERAGLIEIIDCQRVTASGLHVVDGVPAGIYVENARDVTLSGCSVLEAREEPKSTAAIRWRGKGSGNFVTGCRVSSPGKPLDIDPESDVMESGNRMN